ncbi:hypothetical protein [Winogradskyella forsetii]|uniref:hypothetical protein n=1 Tax=Winogradskyella forsetii TaxID=2686077 RepID=UPI0015B9D633|nr:hypothetical protein [Winogradskyella forsetii]
MKLLRTIILFLTINLGYSISAQTVYTTKTGEKYHQSNCRYLKYSKKEISLEKSKSLGYQACKTCKPNTDNTRLKSKSTALRSTPQDTPTSSKKVTATQCTGKTKAGERCKRKTKNTNGRCYQH